MVLYKKIRARVGFEIKRLYYRHNPYYSKHVNIITNIYSKGLFHDSMILFRILKGAGIKVRILDYNADRPLLKSRINIFLEKIPKRYLTLSKYNLFIPNPEWEWGGDDDRFIRNNIDCVIAKTKDCESIFRKIADKVYYTSFTSNDNYSGSNPVREYIHFAGKSEQKGTKCIINVWNKNKLPKLHLYSYKFDYSNEIRTDNIMYRCKMLPDDTIKRLQNEYLFHVCPSEYEGFGHQINEAKSTKSIVITTDSPPMNELVAPEFGFLVKATLKEKVGRAKVYSVDEADMHLKILKSMNLSEKEIRDMRIKSRLSYLKNDSFFKEQILNIMSEYL